MTNLPSVDTVIGQLRKIEAKATRAGWDQPPILYLLHGDDRNPRATIMIASWWSAIPGSGSAKIVNAAYSLERASRDPFGRFLLSELLRMTPNIYGVAFLCEGWCRPVTEDEADEYERSTRSLADYPGASEVRTVAAYDRNGNVYQFTRIRGREPEDVLVSTPEDRGAQVTGLVPEALVRIVAALTGESVDQHMKAVRVPEWLRDKREKS